jgi:hypothetical protein
MAPDALDRPTAAAFASAVLEACAAGPVVLVGGGASTEVPVTQPVRGAPVARAEVADPAVSSAGASRRRLAVAAAAVVALILALGLGEAWGRHGHSAAAALPVASPQSPVSLSRSPTRAAAPSGWVSVVQSLAAARSRAFADADPSLLASVYVAGSSAYSTDLATLRSLVGRGLRAQGFATTVSQVRVERADASTARLHVVDQLSGYTLVDSSGVAHGRGPPRGRRVYTMSLRRTESGWRVVALSPA